jgi:hypothetical protein
MSVAHLALQPRPQPLFERVRQLHAEARELARDHVAAFEQALADAALLAEEIDAGGDAYSVGARQGARRLLGDLVGARLSLQALRGRAL